MTNKIVDAAVKITKGEQDKLELGNLDATRDWGHAKDYVRAMWMILQHDKPDDFVCATGKSRSVRELCELVFSKLGISYKDYVTVDSTHYRPTELHDLKGDCMKLRNILGWTPEYTFDEMIDEMIEAKL